MSCNAFLIDTMFILCAVFFFNGTATTEIYTLSLHDALPISIALFGHGLRVPVRPGAELGVTPPLGCGVCQAQVVDRKSTRLNSSHPSISYAVFCLKKKKNNHLVLSLNFTARVFDDEIDIDNV